jgi:hypothetical protein
VAQLQQVQEVARLRLHGLHRGLQRRLRLAQGLRSRSLCFSKTYVAFSVNLSHRAMPQNRAQARTSTSVSRGSEWSPDSESARRELSKSARFSFWSTKMRLHEQLLGGATAGVPTCTRVRPSRIQYATEEFSRTPIASAVGGNKRAPHGRNGAPPPPGGRYPRKVAEVQGKLEKLKIAKKQTSLGGIFNPI